VTSPPGQHEEGAIVSVPVGIIVGSKSDLAFAEEAATVLDQLGICLLYTSPSQRDRQKSRMPSSA
jgi:phosphoribosylcarboxyaminoimidazole (NCAIR) mutase